MQDYIIEFEIFNKKFRITIPQQKDEKEAQEYLKRLITKNTKITSIDTKEGNDIFNQLKNIMGIR